ncbi:MAG: SAM-dependent methyltransferase [Cyclobacteriaceae bacterium]
MTGLTDSKVQHWLDAHEHEPVTSVLLKGSPFPYIDIRTLAVQLEGRQKAKKKLPKWYASRHRLIWPARISLEQCSSETTARYKSLLISGSRFADLTGGMGVDSYYLARSFSESHYVEKQPELHEVTCHNLKALDSEISCHLNDGIDWLEAQTGTFDWLYLDPARRGTNQQKVIRLQDYSPDITACIPLLQRKATAIMVKVSPMADIRELQRQTGTEASFHVVAVDNECKEILICFGKEVRPGMIHAVNITGDKLYREDFDLQEESLSEGRTAMPKNYLYEPNAAIMKAGTFKAIGNRYKLEKLHENSHLYTSEDLLDHFPGRVFRITEMIRPHRKDLIRALPSGKGSLAVRNFPMSTESLKKKLNLKDGQDAYLFATTLKDGSKTIIITEKAR